MRPGSRTPRITILSALLLSWLAAAGCTSPKAPADAGARHMGERVQVGPLIYTVFEAEWHDQLGEGLNARTPRSRFLLVRLSVTNSGIKDSVIPQMTLIGSNNQTHAEVTNGEGVPEWLGLIRTVKAAGTEHGRVVFDVPSGSYRLRVANEAEPENEKFAFIEIPFQVAPAPPEIPAPQTGARVQ